MDVPVFLFSHEMQLFLHVLANISKSSIQLIPRLQSHIEEEFMLCMGPYCFRWPIYEALNGLQRYVVRSTITPQVFCLLVESRDKKKKNLSRKRVNAQKLHGTVFVLGSE